MAAPELDNGRIADSASRNWVDRYAPAWALPYCRLARLDRPIGTWLLLIPCWWGLALARTGTGGGLPDLWFIALFAVGAIVMRAAGCTYNDIVDRDFDARVARTRSRPIPSGQVSPRAAAAFMVALSLTGLLVLLQFNWFTVWLGIASLGLVAIYPFMKRITYWPQVTLGLTFNWGALLGWTAVTGGLDWPAVMLYASAFAWTLGYDTIYAHQDKEDDALIGLKSTALKFGARTMPWLVGFYSCAIIGIATAGIWAGAGAVFLLAVAAAAAHAAWQLVTLDIDDPQRCLVVFRSNRDMGLVVFAGLVADSVLMSL